MVCIHILMSQNELYCVMSVPEMNFHFDKAHIYKLNPLDTQHTHTNTYLSSNTH